MHDKNIFLFQFLRQGDQINTQLTLYCILQKYKWLTVELQSYTTTSLKLSLCSFVGGPYHLLLVSLIFDMVGEAKVPSVLPVTLLLARISMVVCYERWKLSYLMNDEHTEMNMPLVEYYIIYCFPMDGMTLIPFLCTQTCFYFPIVLLVFCPGGAVGWRNPSGFSKVWFTNQTRGYMVFNIS